MIDDSAMRHMIQRKREGEELSADAWAQIVDSYMHARVDDAQMAALCMAAVWRGMSIDEAAALTGAMVASGDTIEFPAALRVVDKHSSGGVSDIVSLVAVPLAAACGAHVAKLSGRALGHTGGTIDKLETIAGYDVNLPIEKFVAQVETIGCAIVAQTPQIVPADKRIYNLRDRTATVPAMGLIASSIVSKKIAGGAKSFVFDVKTGRAAFMKEPEQARELARWLVAIAKKFGRDAKAFVTDMNEPLGRCIGTGIEVIEAREFLSGSERDPRVQSLVLELVDAMLAAAGINEGRILALEALEDGTAYEKLVQMVEAQGSSRDALEHLQFAHDRNDVAAPQSGYVKAVDVVRLGNTGRELSMRDPVAGLRVHARIGHFVGKGAPLLTAYGGSAADLATAFEFTPEPPHPTRLIYAEL